MYSILKKNKIHRLLQNSFKYYAFLIEQRYDTSCFSLNTSGRVVLVYPEELHIAVTSTDETPVLVLKKREISVDQSIKESPILVGDWVLISHSDTTKHLTLLPRMNEISRLKGELTRPTFQKMCANLDQIIVFFDLSLPFDLYQILRYAFLALRGNQKIILVGNKLDIADPEIVHLIKLKLMIFFKEDQIFFISTQNRTGNYEELLLLFEPSLTTALIGNTGVGKSSFINRLFNRKMMKIGEVSKNKKGKHTTSHRQLFFLKNGSSIIDMPGIGLAYPYIHRNDLLDFFSQIRAYAALCEFYDCSHLHERNCEVMHAVDIGDLDIEIYESYQYFVQKTDN